MVHMVSALVVLLLCGVGREDSLHSVTHHLAMDDHLIIPGDSPTQFLILHSPLSFPAQYYQVTPKMSLSSFKTMGTL